MKRLPAVAALAAVVMGSLLAAQSPTSGPPSAVRRAAATITEATVRSRIYLIAHDSMGGRNTPSPGLDKTARYIASEFRRFGLKPGGDSGSFLQRYPIARRQLLAARSVVSFKNAGENRTITSSLAQGAALLFGPTAASASGEVLLVGGLGALDTLPPAEAVKGRVVVYVPGPNTQLNRVGFRALSRLGTLGASAVAIVVSSDSLFAAYARNQGLVQTVVGRRGGIPVVAVLERGITEQVPEAAQEFAMVRDAPVAVMQPVPDWAGEIVLRDTALTETLAPNVVGILEGSDPALRDQYLVYSAHMDHIGTAGQPGASCRARGGDSICNGADDDGSGTVGIVELAKAFSQPGARAKRSIIFLTVSGEEHGLWGSQWFATNPPVPLERIVANFNADMIGRNWKDTVVAIGKEHSDLGATLARVNSAHPELGLTVIDDPWPDERFYFRSDHYNFAVKGVPILFFFTGVHADYHQATDSPDKIDAEKESRILRLMFYLGREVGNASERPKWNPDSYRAIVGQ
ncbi:MAG: M28 family peptidase [Gemmatimonadales bacterium]